MPEGRDTNQLFADGAVVDGALRRAAMAARHEYVRFGLAMPVWRAGRLVWIMPRDLEAELADEQAVGGARSFDVSPWTTLRQAY